MLKEVATGQILKTKSEISALQAFIAWLEAAAAAPSHPDSTEDGATNGGQSTAKVDQPAAAVKGGQSATAKSGPTPTILLVSHEQDRQVLAPLLIQALEKYHLLESFNKIVKGTVP